MGCLQEGKSYFGEGEQGEPQGKSEGENGKTRFFIRVNGFFFLKVDSAEEIECWTVQ